MFLQIWSYLPGLVDPKKAKTTKNNVQNRGPKKVKKTKCSGYGPPKSQTPKTNVKDMDPKSTNPDTPPQTQTHTQACGGCGGGGGGGGHGGGGSGGGRGSDDGGGAGGATTARHRHRTPVFASTFVEVSGFFVWAHSGAIRSGPAFTSSESGLGQTGPGQAKCGTSGPVRVTYILVRGSLLSGCGMVSTGGETNKEYYVWFPNPNSCSPIS